MNKGLTLHFCKVCKRKRYFSKVPIPNHNYKWTCSKGHTFIAEGVTVERVMSVMNEFFSSEKMRNIFNRDDIFYKYIK